MPDLKPNVEATRRFFARLFPEPGRNARDLIEMAWCIPNRSGWRAQLYSTTALDKLVDHAASLNAIEGTSVYFGPAYRRIGTDTNHRTSDSDVATSCILWVDLDDPAEVQKARERCKAAPPQAGVVTSRHPGLRLQLFWRVTEPYTDMRALRAQLSAIQVRLGGDPAVVNPSRLMRTGGSVNWASKPGRVDELTEVIVPDDRPPAYSAYEMAAAFPLPPPPPPPKPLKPIDLHKVNAYAARAAADELTVPEHATEGARNNTLNVCTLKLAGLVLAGALPEGWVRAQIRERAKAVGLSPREIDATMASAWQAATPREIQQWFGHANKAVALGLSGRIDEAREALRSAVGIQPKFDRTFVEAGWPWQRREDLEGIIIEGLLKAGWEG